MEQNDQKKSHQEDDSFKEQKNKELMFKFAMFEQQIQQIQEQLKAIDQARTEFLSLSSGLEELKNSNNREIFASIGKGIFIKAKILEDDLIVDVGGKNFVKKSVNDAQDIIGEQIKKFESAKDELEDNLEEINSELTEVMIQHEKK